MKKFLSFLLVFLMVPCCVWASFDTVEELEAKMNIDIDTANIATLKAVVEAYDEELSVYYDLIDKCLQRLELLGEERWVVEYRGIPENAQLDTMSFSELVALHDQINLAIWKSKEWQEVTVPQGIWIVGKDIPAGTWTVKCADVGRTSYIMQYCSLEWGESLHESGRYVNWSGRYDTNVHIYNPNHKDYEGGHMTEYILTVENGDYIIISGTYNQAVFTPYTGKPSLGFK